MEVCVVDIHFIALGHYMPPHTAHTALLKPQQANGIYVSMPQKLRGRLPNLSSYNIAGPCAGDLGCYRVVQLEHDVLSVARGLRASDSHDKTRSVAEYEAIDAVLQVALNEVICTEACCLIQAQGRQGLGQQWTLILIDDLHWNLAINHHDFYASVLLLLGRYEIPDHLLSISISVDRHV